VYGRIDVLVNNAGIWIEGELDRNSVEDIRKVIEVNTLGQIYMTRAVVPLMKKRKSGLVVNIISQAGLNAKAERSVYNAAKFGMTGFTKSMQEELHKYGIRVSGVYPSKVRTELFSKVGVNKSMSGAMAPEDVAQVVDFLVSRPDNVEIPEIGIKDIDY
jgi:NADP-dependent 3-hydroxy acid dehydrogenase YdfG